MKKMKRFLSMLLAFCVVTSNISTANVVFANEDSDYDNFRDKVLGNITNNNAPKFSGETLDMSNIISLPQVYEPLDLNDSATFDLDEPAQIDYVEGDTRLFKVDGASSSENKTGTLVAQSDNVNIWYVDTGYSNQLTETAVASYYSDILAKTQEIYESMTDNFTQHKQIYIGNSSIPYVGDVDNDGKINILLYDIDNDGSASNFVAGNFDYKDMYENTTSNDTPSIDVLHMDIGKNQGGNILGQAEFYATFAHEFQHLLFYSNLGWKTENNSNINWYNESLSGLAELYYSNGAYDGTQTPNVEIFQTAIKGSYEGDFVNLSILNADDKSYGMAYLFSSFMDSLYEENYPKKVYEYFNTVKIETENLNTTGSGGPNWKYTLSDSHNVFYSDTTVLSKYDREVNEGVLGGAFKKVIGNSNSNVDTFGFVYRLFMEAFAADGGEITLDLDDVEKSIYPKLWADQDLWELRLAENIPELGATISLTAGTSLVEEATHDALYKIDTTAITESYLDITVGNASTAEELFAYVVLYDATSKNGEMHQLNIGESNKVDLDNKTPYLFATTLYKDIADVTVTIVGGAAPETTPPTPPQLEFKDLLPTPVISYNDGNALDNNLKDTDTLKITVTGVEDEDYKIQWYRIPEKTVSVGAISNDYQPIDGANSAQYLVSEYDIGYQLAVSIAPTTDALDTYRDEFVYSALTNKVADSDNRVQLDNITVAYAEGDNTTLVIKYKGGLFEETDEIYYAWAYDGSNGVPNIIAEGNTCFSYEIQEEDKGRLIYVGVFPGYDNTEFTQEAAWSNEILIDDKDNLPTPVIYLGNTAIGDTAPTILDTLSVKVIDNGTEITNLIYKWYVEDVVVETAKSITGADNEITFYVDPAYVGKEIYVTVEPDTTIDAYSQTAVPSDKTQPVESIYYDVEYKLTDLTSDKSNGTKTVPYGEYSFTLSPSNSTNHSLPDTITVVMGSDTLTNSDYTYNTTTGKVVIDKVTNNLVITATAKDGGSGGTDPDPDPDPDTENPFKLNIDGMTFASCVYDATTKEYTIVLNKGSSASFPEDIIIKIGSQTISDHPESYNKSTGTIVIKDTIIAQAEALSGDIYITTSDSTPPQADTFTVSKTISDNITQSDETSTTVEENEQYSITLTANEGYTLDKDSIKITMGSSTLTNADICVFNGDSKVVITIPNVTGNIVITASVTGEDVPETFTVSKNINANITQSDETSTPVEENDEYSITLTAKSGFTLDKDSIKISMGSSTLTNADICVFTGETKVVITIPNVTGNIVITASVTGEDVPETGEVFDVYFYVGTNISLPADTSKTANQGEAYTLTLTPETSYVLPSEVLVSMEDEAGVKQTLVLDDDYTYNTSTGVIKILNVTGEITFNIGNAILQTDHIVSFILTKTTSSKVNNDTVKTGEDYSFTLTPSSNYELPSNITVKMGDTTLTKSTGYIYSNSTGAVTVYNVTDDLQITVVSTLIEDDDDDDDNNNNNDDDDDDDDTSYTVYTITFVDSYGNTITSLDTGSNYTLSYIPSALSTSDDKVFIGWYYNNAPVTTSTRFSSNATVVAKTSNIFYPTNNGNGNYYINTSNSDIAIYVNDINNTNGGTITVNSSNVDNFIIIPTSSQNTINSTTTIVLPDSNGNTATWSIPAGSVINSSNYLNLGIIIRDYYNYDSNQNGNYYGRSIGYIDFAHAGSLLSNYQPLTLTFRMSNANSNDRYSIYKLNNYQFTSQNVTGNSLGNNYIRANFYECSRWEVVATNYNVSPDGSYTQYYNIPTTGYISELRNVTLNQVLDLTKINVGNGLVIEGWYYDSNFTNPVSNPSYVVVSDSIIKTGLYPKYVTDYVTPETGNPYPDSGNNFKPDISTNPNTNSKG